MGGSVEQLEQQGWLVNQQRMWLASQYSVRAGHSWRAGEQRFFQHLLDGSRAANRLGWQWVVGTGSGKPYGFSRRQVERRAPGLCRRCPLEYACPIQEWPAEGGLARVEPPAALSGDGDPAVSAGPFGVERRAEPEAVWLTGESLGDADPALAARPDLPAVFVWDAPLLHRLRLSGKRLVFLVETLAELGTRRRLELHRGDPVAVLRGRALAVTHAPVPGFRRRAPAIDPAELHPWPWLVPPHDGPAQSFSAWRRRGGGSGSRPGLRRRGRPPRS